MTKRLYYTDAYTSSFQATVLEQTEYNGKPAVVLDQTYFYPTSGGQPFDTGLIGGRQVIDVIVRGEDDAVLHLLETGDPLPSQVEGLVSRERRFDHMQQHCGQHILSRAFIEVNGGETVGFHLGDKTCTIDIDKMDPTEAEIEAAERLANQIIWENRPVDVRFVNHAEAATLSLRKLPPVKGDEIRLVDIYGFDLTACGGTHPKSTGEIGLLKILRSEKRKKKRRIEFVCGSRAVADYGHKNRVILDLMKTVSTRSSELESAFIKQRDELKGMSRSLRLLKDELAGYKAKELEAGFESQDGFDLLIHLWSLDDYALEDLRPLARSLTSSPNRVVLFGLFGSAAMFFFQRSDNLELHMGNLLKQALEIADAGRGGGRPDQAQGGGVPLTREKMASVLHAIRENLA